MPGLVPGIDASYPSSFRGDAKQRTRNLEVPGLALRTVPEWRRPIKGRGWPGKGQRRRPSVGYARPWCL